MKDLDEIESMSLQQPPHKNRKLVNVPQTNILQSWIASLVIWLMGWRLEGFPPDLPKMVMIGAPHTSNLDVFLMVMMCWKMRIRVSYLVANDLRFPLNKLSVWANGIPIDRNNPNNDTVQQVVDYMNNADKCVLMIAPEGRLKRVEYWRSGFYYIALGVGVPIVPGYMDYKRKLIGLTDMFMPSGDIIADMEPLKDFYEGITPRFPEKASPVRIRERSEAMNKRLNERAARQAEDQASKEKEPG